MHPGDLTKLADAMSTAVLKLGSPCVLSFAELHERWNAPTPTTICRVVRWFDAELTELAAVRGVVWDESTGDRVVLELHVSPVHWR